MASFIQTTSTSATAFALTTAESGFFGAGGTYSLASGSIVTLSGTGSNLTVLGTIYAQGTSAVVGINASADIFVGGQASVIGNGGIAAIHAGGVITNYGTIYSQSAANAIVGNFGSLTVVNHGRIGLPQVATYAIGFDASSGAFRVDNFGTIDGHVGANATATAFSVTNSGIINGKVVDFSTTDGLVRNTGWITGNVEFGGGADIYDGRGGRASGEVRGGIGNDVLIGGLGADRLFGEGDNDNLFFDAEDLNFGVVDGGSGLDTGYNMDNVTAITIDLAGRSLERYLGSAADEVVLATNVSVATIIRSGAGNDVIIGSALGDQLSGDVGNDYIDGGVGGDTIDGGLGSDTVLGGLGDDIIFGGDGVDIIEGGADDDTIIGDAGDDIWLFGGSGVDVIVGGLGNDVILGGEGNDIYLDGAEGNDQVSGGDGNDTILGGAGDDLFLSGDAGNDFIIGGAGADVMIGGEGNDAFQFFTADFAAGVPDRITDFRVVADDTDSLLLEGTLASYTFTDQGSNTLITHTSGATILLEGISSAAVFGQTSFFV